MFWWQDCCGPPPVCVVFNVLLQPQAATRGGQQNPDARSERHSSLVWRIYRELPSEHIYEGEEIPDLNLLNSKEKPNFRVYNVSNKLNVFIYQFLYFSTSTETISEIISDRSPGSVVRN